MKQIFGSAWGYGDEPNQTWENQLLRLTVDELNQGKKTIFELALDFPPNLFQFINYCKKGMPRDKVNDVVRPNFNQGQLPPNYERPCLPTPDGEINAAQRAGLARRELQDFYRKKTVSHETKKEKCSTEELKKGSDQDKEFWDAQMTFQASQQ